MLLFFIALYLGLTLAIGWWASRRVHSTTDFVLAGRKLSTPILSAGLFATWFGSETVLGAPSAFIEGGLLGIIEDPFGAALCLVLVGLIFARPLYRLNILTFNDFYRMRYGRTAEVVSALFMVPSYFGWIAAQLVAMAIVMQVLIGLPLFWGIALCTIVVVIYTYIGGMWAVSVTDFVQTIMIILGLAVLCGVLYAQVGSWERLRAPMPPRFFQFLPARSLDGWVHYLAAWATIGLGSIPQQDVFQRVMAARNERVAVRAGVASGLLYLSIGLMPIFIGWCGQVLYPDFRSGDPQLLLPQMVLRHSPEWLQILFFGALLSAILSTTAGAILAPATVVGENLLRPWLRHPSDATMLRIMRGSVVGIALCSAVMANFNANIYELVGDSSALSLVGLFLPLACGLFWKRTTGPAATAAMLVGMAVWLYYEYVAPGAWPSLVPGTLASLVVIVGWSWLWPDNSYQQFLAAKARQETLPPLGQPGIPPG